jgi:hypothetical protein
MKYIYVDNEGDLLGTLTATTFTDNEGNLYKRVESLHTFKDNDCELCDLIEICSSLPMEFKKDCISNRDYIWELCKKYYSFDYFVNNILEI